MCDIFNIQIALSTSVTSTDRKYKNRRKKGGNREKMRKKITK